MVCLCFFFFKQKTAYEMRISDWSSDVCSSDLPALGVVITQEGLVQAALFLALDDGHRVALVGDLAQRVLARMVHGRGGGHWRRIERLQIGRASCRERVCQYV